MGDIDSELRAISGAKGNSFTIRHGEHAIEVTYSTDNDDDITGLSISVGYDRAARHRRQTYRDEPPLVGQRPMAIELRRENAADVEAKDGGVSVEWQSGDATFDAKVYVDSPVSDAALLARVIGADARAGVLELFELGFTSVQIDTEPYGNVVASLPRSSFANNLETPGGQALAAFERILSQLPAITPSGQKRQRYPLLSLAHAFLIVIGGAGWLVNVGYVGGLVILIQHLAGHAIEFTTLMVIGPVVFGLVSGVLFGGFFRRVVERAHRGASDAHRRGSRAAIIGFAGFSVIAFSLALILAGLYFGEAPK